MRGAWIAAALIALAGPRQDRAIQNPRVFHAATDLITVTATVRDRDGRLITDLDASAFDVHEDGEPRTVAHVTAERIPLSVAILLDTSDSMFGERLRDARDAVEQFTEGLDPADEFAIIAFNHAIRVIVAWGRDREAVHTELQRLRPFGSTALFDALIGSLPFADTRHLERVAFLVISDGADTASDAKLRDVRAALNRHDGFVYAVAIDAPGRYAINAAVDTIALSEITDQSGGRTEIVHSTGALAGALSRIADELNHQYVLGYTSPKSRDGEFHSIRVRIRDHADYRVQARKGYVAARTARP
jgi:Ca-activated chloride channel homolog